MGIKKRSFTSLQKKWRNRNSEVVFSFTGIYMFENRLEYSNCVRVCRQTDRQTRHFLCQEFTERKCHCGVPTHSLAISSATSDYTLGFSLRLFCFVLWSVSYITSSFDPYLATYSFPSVQIQYYFFMFFWGEHKCIFKRNTVLCTGTHE